MKKFLAGIFLIVFCLSFQAYGAQVQIHSADLSESSYLSTVKKVYTVNVWVYKFNADGKTNYPYEIYLPNEQRPDQYRIHTSYTKNTDACASCHATHTAVGDSLLQWYSIYETCMACHDGTVTSTYNVEQGSYGNNHATSGGGFGTGKERSLSYHNVTGGVLIGAAPGGSPAIGKNIADAMGCESCHSPHGMGGNARILNPDPNGIQTQQYENNSTFKSYTLVEIQPSESLSEVVYVAYPNADTSLTPYYMLKGYPYPLKVFTNGTEITDFEADNSAGFTKIIVPVGAINGNMTAEFIPSLRVRMQIDNYLGFTGDELVTYRDGTQEFCAACHGLYGKDSSGGNKHHPVGAQITDSTPHVTLGSDLYENLLKYKLESNNTMVCLTCHVAHGVSGDYWQKVMGYDSKDAYELAGSSALKRVPNSGICLGCHPMDAGNEGYASNSGQLVFTPEPDVYDATFNQPLGIENFVGLNATNCTGGCHDHIEAKWEATKHAKALQVATASSVKATFPATETNLASVNNVVYVIGNDQYQRYVYLEGITLKVATGQFKLSNNTWETKADGNPDFVDKCAGCHATGVDVVNKTWKDNAVACEACHGAASSHKQVGSSTNISNPRYLRIPDQTDVCAQCHALGESNNGMVRPFPVNYTVSQGGLNTVDRAAYKLDQFFTMTVTSGDAQYPAQEFNDFVQSKHYESNVISCITCHSAHEPNLKGQMLKGTTEQICGACHDTIFKIDDVMPKVGSSIQFRVHTFTKQHTTVSPSGTQIH